MDLSTLQPDQRQVVTTLDRPLFVSAGAGSGKTLTLTNRIVWALSLASGPFVKSLDQVLAITFTTDAAAEIRERVRSLLIREGMEQEALQVDDAWISTIHGMCARILRTHALELGIDPEFSVLTDTDELIDAAIEQVISAAAAQLPGACAIDELLRWYPLKGDVSPTGDEKALSVYRLVRQIIELCAPLPNGIAALQLERGSFDCSAMADAARAAHEVTGPAGKQVLEGLLAALETFEASEHTPRDFALLLAAYQLPRAQGRAKEAVAALKYEAAECLINACIACGRAAQQQLVALARAVEKAYQDLKAERSALDNNDLLRCAHAALRDYPSIRKAYEGRFKLVMIDEFQDTDQQQVDLIGYLTGEDGRALCTVGDAQQSIYRFRGAEVEVFRRLEQRIAQQSDEPFGGRIVTLDKNFRSHAGVLSYVEKIFDGDSGGLMKDFLRLSDHEGRKDGLRVPGASRRQALLVAGGTRDQRTQMKAQALAQRFRALVDAGQPAGDMVLLLGKMNDADVYAQAFRAEGLDCVISGGSVFANTNEAQTIRALAAALANPLDGAQGLFPVLTSDLFALGATELLALATTVDEATGEIARRSLDAGLMADDCFETDESYELLEHARTVLRAALARVGSDPLSSIVADVVRASGWFVRLAAQGAQGKAAAANVLKALDALKAAEDELGNAPRELVAAYDRFLAGKEAPGALNEGESGAVKIMTVHASKGLEYPVVAIADCFSIRKMSSQVRTQQQDACVRMVTLPGLWQGVRLSDGTYVSGKDLKDKRFKKLLETVKSDDFYEVCAQDSAAGAYRSFGEQGELLDLQERERLLYVAMTRAREVCILALDAKLKAGKSLTLDLDEQHDLTGAVLERILPSGLDNLEVDRLDFSESVAGDFELIALSDFNCEGRSYTATLDDTEVLASAGTLEDELCLDELDTFTLADTEIPVVYAVPEGGMQRISYSYSSQAADVRHSSDQVPDDDAAELLEDDTAGLLEDGADELQDTGAAESLSPGSSEHKDARTAALAFGSAFHAAAQWLIETGAERLPHERIAAYALSYQLDEEHTQRLKRALRWWEASPERAQLMSWPCVRAEVPFFCPAPSGSPAPYVEGALDVLATDPHRPKEALVIDYKTGGSPEETPEDIQRKHELQAQVYAQALHTAGFEAVTLHFVRVEVGNSVVFHL